MATRTILALAFLLGACLPAFAPPIRSKAHHRNLSPDAADPTCLACHPTADDLHGEVRHGGPPVVPSWMVYDSRGCVGCHDVKEPRR